MKSQAHRTLAGPLVRRLIPRFSTIAAEANRRLAEEYGERLGVPSALLLRGTRPHALWTFLRTPIPLSVLGGLLLAVFFISLHVPFLLALPLGYGAVAALGYAILCAAGERGMAMGARAVTYQEGEWTTVEEATRAIAPSLYHGWTHLAGRRGLLRLHNSVAVAAGYLRARELGDAYPIVHFPELEQSVAAGRVLGGWSDLERRVQAETRGPIGWLREWTKYQYLGHSRNAYVLGGLLAGRALAVADDAGGDPWCCLRLVAAGASMCDAEATTRERATKSCQIS